MLQPPTPSSGHMAGARPWVLHLGFSLTPHSRGPVCAQLFERTQPGGVEPRHQTPEPVPSGSAVCLPKVALLDLVIWIRSQPARPCTQGASHVFPKGGGS